MDILRGTVGVYLDHLNRNKDMIRLALVEMPSIVRGIQEEEARRHIHRMPWLYVEYVQKGLERGMDAGQIRRTNPRVLALALLGAAQNITLYHLYNQPDKDLNELLDDIVEVVKNMILTSPCEQERSR